MPKPSFENHPIFELEGPLATITFNRPDKANAMHPDQNALMRNFLYEVERKPEIRCVLLKGNGKHFMAAGDLVIAADTSFYWAAHILHGGSNDGLLTYFLPRHIGLRKSLEMALLGERVYAPEAKQLGLVNFVVPEAELQNQTRKLVDRLCNGPTLGYALIKKLMYASFGNSMAEQGALEAELYGSRALHTADVKDGLKAFFERRPPNFQGK